MGKEKIEEKDVRLLRYAVEQAFDGAMRDGARSYDVYGLHVAHDGKKEKKPLRAEWLVHELTDAGEEV